MKLYPLRTTDNHGEIHWVIFWEGELAKPVAVLTDLEIRRFVRDVEQQIEERKKQNADMDRVQFSEGLYRSRVGVMGIWE